MALSKEDINALEEAKDALEASVRVSMLARNAVVKRLDEAYAAQNPGTDQMATFGMTEPQEATEDAPCLHVNTKEIPSMGDTVTSICFACNATLRDGEPVD